MSNQDHGEGVSMSDNHSLLMVERLRMLRATQEAYEYGPEGYVSDNLRADSALNSEALTLAIDKMLGAWLPIFCVEAPLNEEILICQEGGQGKARAAIQSPSGDWTALGPKLEFIPTHWMPLPPGPLGEPK